MRERTPRNTALPETEFFVAEASRPYPLLRYYVLTSLAVISIVTVVVAVLFVRRAEQEFATRSAEQSMMEAAHLANLFFHDVWAPQQQEGEDLNLRDVADPEVLRGFYGGSAHGLSLVALTVLKLDGTVLWTSGESANEPHASGDMGDFATVVHQGTPMARLLRDEVTMDTAGGKRRLDLVKTYHPLRDIPLDAAIEGRLLGVIEMKQDVTDALARARRGNLLLAVLGSVATGAALFTLLFLFVYRADRNIVRGHRRLIGQQRKLAESEGRLRTVFEYAPIGMVFTDEDGRLLFANKQFKRMVGYDDRELDGMSFATLTHPDDLPGNMDLFQEMRAGLRDSYVYEKRYLTKDGSTVWGHMVVSALPDSGDGVCCVAMVEDVTERKRTEKALVESTRLASIGQLAAGVAHEVNNPLTTVMSFAKLLELRGLPADAAADVEKIYSEAVRATGIVQNLLSFARKRDVDARPQTIVPVIQRALDLKRYQLDDLGITVTTDWPEGLANALVDEDQMLEVLLNILTNAEQALADHRGHRAISIEARHNSRWLTLFISDNGPGIQAEHLAKVFDPFFTTKHVGQGTGLGLSICYGIVQQHGGELTVESVPGQGTTFTIELVAVDGGAVAVPDGALASSGV